MEKKTLPRIVLEKLGKLSEVPVAIAVFNYLSLQLYKYGKEKISAK